MWQFIISLALVAGLQGSDASPSCVPPPTCPKPNEVYTVCPPKCPFQTCGIDDTLIDCIPQPVPGDKDCPPPKCICKPHYFRDDKGNCVPWEKCPKCKGINEVYDPCDAPCPQRTCDFDPTVTLCMKPPQLGDKECVVGCRCQDGYLRNSQGVCVPQDQCPKKCTMPNEVFVPCPDCSPQTCETRNNTYNCPAIPADSCDPSCKPACRCKPGYYRNKIGECISAKECDKCLGAHEYWSCGPACDNRCDSIYGQDNCNIVNIKCNPMCYCEKGYARATNNTCIPKEDCQYECPVNEEYNECPDALCQAKKCSEAGYPLECPEIPTGQCPGKPGCVCKHGYLRDCNGKCVPVEECPSCGGDKNATSGCGTNCGKHCSDYKNKEIGCILMCYPNGCECRDGYVYDDNVKKCVRPTDCTPVCQADEVYSTCVNDCSKRDCSDLNGGIVCVEPTVCKDGCVCKDGYLRNKAGKCVPIEQCDNCPANEEYNDCPAAICAPKKCCEVGFPINCTTNDEGGPHPCPGKPGCICRSGYLRDDKGVCIPSDKCPSCGGDVNATMGCSNHCGNSCADYQTPNPICPLRPCRINECACREGYVYDYNMERCVLPCDCTPVCKENEVFSKCANGGCNKKYCTDLGQPDKCEDPLVCKAGCICAEGYLRNRAGVCVPEGQCDNCPVNEEYYECPDAECIPKACTDAGFALNCTTLKEGDPCPCKPGCLCKDGYLRNSKGVCVPKDNCPSCGNDKNATMGCGNHCGKSCSDYNQPPKPCPYYCMANGCDCRDGYVYDENTKKCVLPCDCVTCGLNEVYDACDAPCPARTCAFDPTVVKCSAPPKVGDSTCLVGCRCRDGYLRNDKGVCVPADQCPPKCKENEILDMCPDCNPQTCDTIGKQLPCPKLPCKAACRCKEGFVRDDNGNCVAIDYCYKCPANEEYNKCPAAVCLPKKCSDLGYPLNCTTVKEGDPCPGKPGCICKSGYMRDCNGVCIPTENCPSCGGDNNATQGCGNHCGNTCADYQNPTNACPLGCILNGCNCRKGYVYDGNTKKCVLPCDCTPKCKANEYWDDCPDCNPQTCSTIDIALPCAPTPCKGACRCKKGYVRDDKGNCVPKDICYKCPKNEEYNKCPATLCIAKKCSDLGYPLNCTTVKEGDPCPGKPGCICKSGYMRDCNGVCIPTENCPSCGGDNNATQGCGTHCGNTCDDYQNPPKVCPPGCILNGCNCRKGYVYDEKTKKCVLPCDCSPKCKANEYWDDCPDCNPQTCSTIDIALPCAPTPCKGACRCKKGYVRDDKGNCVPKDICYKCPKNEEYNKCPAAICKAKKCTDVGFPLNCTTVKEGDPCPGKPGCICKSGYLRDCDGVCIPSKNCPTCGGDRNATMGCGLNCGKRCSNYNKPPSSCPIACVVNGCECRDGYVYDDNTKKCVLPCDCTPVCKENEVYSTCANGGCDKKTCSDLNKSDCCVYPKICKVGCVCKKGYLRDNCGCCIPIDKCPKV